MHVGQRPSFLRLLLVLPNYGGAMLLKLKNIGKIYNSNDILTIGIRNINL